MGWNSPPRGTIRLAPSLDVRSKKYLVWIKMIYKVCTALGQSCCAERSAQLDSESCGLMEARRNRQESES